MGSAQSSLNVSEDGFHLLISDHFLSGIVVGNNSNSNNNNNNNETSNNNNNNSGHQQFQTTLSNYYRAHSLLFPGSGRMMRTYRMLEQPRSTGSSSTPVGGGNNSTVGNQQQQQQQQQQQYSQSSAVIKAGWILCAKTNATQQPVQGTTNSNNAGQTSTGVVPPTFASIEEQFMYDHSMELKRIKDVCYKSNLTHVAPFIAWFVGTSSGSGSGSNNSSSNNNNSSRNEVKNLIPRSNATADNKGSTGMGMGMGIGIGGGGGPLLIGGVGGAIGSSIGTNMTTTTSSTGTSSAGTTTTTTATSTSTTVAMTANIANLNPASFMALGIPPVSRAAATRKIILGGTTTASSASTSTRTTSTATATTITTNTTSIVPQEQQSSLPPIQFTYSAKPVYLIRPYIYTTLADRLTSRPFLTNCEKLWITYQLLDAIDSIHRNGIVHGSLTTENIGLTSAGWVVLMDMAPYKLTPSTLALPDDDPSEYMYYFQPQQVYHRHHPQQNQQSSSSTSSTSSTNSSSGNSNDNPSGSSSQQASSSNNTTISSVAATTTTASASTGGGAGAGAGETSTNRGSGGAGVGEKRCYLAPERFYSSNTATVRNKNQNTSSSSSSSTAISPAINTDTSGNKETLASLDSAISTTTTEVESPDTSSGTIITDSNIDSVDNNANTINKSMTVLTLTPAMDIFSLGCVLTELFLNGERCFDLGELLEYRRRCTPTNSGTNTSTNNTTTPTAGQLPPPPPFLQQKLNKIESSHIRAACRHMLSMNPNTRLSAKQYYDRLAASKQFPSSFPMLTSIVEHVTATTKTTTTSAMSNTTTTTTSSPQVLQTRGNYVVDDNVEGGSTEVRVVDPPVNENSKEIGKEMGNTNTSSPNSDTGDLLGSLSKAAAVASMCPDARIAYAASVYGKVIWECLGIRDKIGEAYFDKVLGRTWTSEKKKSTYKHKVANVEEEKKEDNVVQNTEDLMAQVEALLKDLQTLDLDIEETQDIKPSESTIDTSNQLQQRNVPLTGPDQESSNHETQSIARSSLVKNSILIYLQLILSNVRNVQRPTTKLIAMKLIDRIGMLCDSDEARLQRIVPVMIAILEEDQDAMVRAFAIKVVTNTLSIIQTFPPSDSKLFPQYILKRVGKLLSDPSLIVRIAFTTTIAVLTETAHRFLDITHAVRLYEAVGNSGGTTSRASMNNSKPGSDVFDASVAKLLDNPTTSIQQTSSSSLSRLPTAPTVTAQPKSASNSSDMKESESVVAGKKALIIRSSYSAELAILQETVSRWIVHIMTDQSEHSSLQKRVILSDLGPFSTFLGLDGVMSYVLPHTLAFLNERKDWELRAALFENLPSVCHIIGRAATEDFFLPCIETGLVDSEERVIGYALSCVSRLVELGLLSRAAILGIDSSLIDGKLEPNNNYNYNKNSKRPFLRKYGVLLLFPSEDVRLKAIETYITICNAVGSPDREVLVAPQLKPFFRFQPQTYNLTSVDGMQKCLHPPWPRRKYNELLRTLSHNNRKDSIPGVWTSIGVSISEENDEAIEAITRDRSIEVETKMGKSSSANDPFYDYFHEYLQMLVRHSVQAPPQISERSSLGLSNGIEGNVKLAQSIMFPRQNGRNRRGTLPEWYSSLREKAAQNKTPLVEAAAITSIATLGNVYGLSILGPVEGMTENFVAAADNVTSIEDSIIQTSESKKVEAAIQGEWGSETILDPDTVDTCLLIPKLKALGVPPLPPPLGGLGAVPLKLVSTAMKEAVSAADSKPRIQGLVATSVPHTGHTAPVVRLAMSKDQYFFVSGSHDGTCRVWGIPHIENSDGILESTVTYSEHSKARATRINDVAMLEGTHSVASGASDGSVHVWRVDVVQSEAPALQKDSRFRRDKSRVAGTSSIRNVDPNEGEILAVSHFNNSAASVVTYATQRGIIHSWDLRCAREPFAIRHSPELGYLSSMALGSDRNWMVSGTNKGYIVLWDIRFQEPVKLWQHTRRSPITRLATSFVLPPQYWNTQHLGPSPVNPLPYIFVATGYNECSMFDAISGSCSECFRTMSSGDSRDLNGNVAVPAHLADIPIDTRSRDRTARVATHQNFPSRVNPVSTINCMVGSIGANSNSYLVTGGSDGAIRFWDFWRPANCYVVSGRSNSRTSFERIDFEQNNRLMLCRESGSHASDNNSSPSSNKLWPRVIHDIRKDSHHHTDSVQDIKIIDNSTVISCSRDCTVKVWR